MQLLAWKNKILNSPNILLYGALSGIILAILYAIIAPMKRILSSLISYPNGSIINQAVFYGIVALIFLCAVLIIKKLRSIAIMLYAITIIAIVGSFVIDGNFCDKIGYTFNTLFGQDSKSYDYLETNEIICLDKDKDEDEDEEKGLIYLIPPIIRHSIGYNGLTAGLFEGLFFPPFILIPGLTLLYFWSIIMFYKIHILQKSEINITNLKKEEIK